MNICNLPPPSGKDHNPPLFGINRLPAPGSQGVKEYFLASRVIPGRPYLEVVTIYRIWDTTYKASRNSGVALYIMDHREPYKSHKAIQHPDLWTIEPINFATIIIGNLEGCPSEIYNDPCWADLLEDIKNAIIMVDLMDS